MLLGCSQGSFNFLYFVTDSLVRVRWGFDSASGDDDIPLSASGVVAYTIGDPSFVVPLCGRNLWRVCRISFDDQRAVKGYRKSELADLII